VKLTVMSITPSNEKSGKKELKYYCEIAGRNEVDIVLFPSSFLPYYKNSSAFYTQTNIESLVDVIPNDLLVIVGVNEAHKDSFYKSTVSFTSEKILNVHKKVDIEQHYLDKGFSKGDGSGFQFVWKNVKINPLECFEILFSKNWDGADIVTGSIGFGMMAKTNEYNCDYFDQWLNIVKANCLVFNCYAILSCNGQHRDFMTVAVNSSGELIGMARTTGYFLIDIDLKDFRRDKTPYQQENKRA